MIAWAWVHGRWVQPHRYEYCKDATGRDCVSVSYFCQHGRSMRRCYRATVKLEHFALAEYEPESPRVVAKRAAESARIQREYDLFEARMQQDRIGALDHPLLAHPGQLAMFNEVTA
jgi:hypothetical protein